MARIPTYELDQVFDDNDLLLGTDGATSALTTKNFSLAGLAEYVIDKLIDPDATSFCIPVFRDPANTQGANATRITSSIIQQSTYPNGGKISVSGTLDAIKKIQVRGDGERAGQLELNCENNNHGVAIQSPPHSAGASYTMILPVDIGTAGKQLTTDGVSQLYWADPEDDNLDIAADTNTGSIDLDTQALTISGGTLISTTVNPNGGQNIIVSHDSVSRTDNGNQISLNFGGAFDAETSIQTDQGGHVELVNTTTYTLPANPVPSDNVTGEGRVGYPAFFTGDHTISGISFADAQTKSGYVPGVITSFVDLGSQGPGHVPIGVNWKFYDGGGNPQGDGSINQQGTMTIGKTAFGNGGRLVINESGFTGTTNHRLNVGGNARIEGRVNITAGGLCVSNNPNGVQLDNTSMVIGAGDNDIISGSDNSMIVGKANQLQKTTTGSGSDQSAAIGSLNILTDASNSLAVGRGNSLIGTGVNDVNGLRSQVIGLNNQLKDTFSSIVIGGENEININETSVGQNTHVFGYLNKISGYGDNVYAIGNKIDLNAGGGASNFYAFGSNIKIDQNVYGVDTMAIGIRNSATLSYTPDNNKGLGYPALTVGAGSTNYGTYNALIITKQTGSGSSPGSRIIMPSVPAFSASNDAAADAIGIPTGGLYQNNGVVQVNQGGGSTTDPLAGGGGITQTTGTYTPQLIANTPSEWVISSYSIQQGKWVRTGNMVFCDFTIIINASNISGNTGGTSGLTIQGWPYDHDGGAGSFQGGALNQCDGFDVEPKGSNVTLNSGLGNAKLNITKQNAAITNYFVTHSMKTGDFNNGNQVNIKGSFSYLTTDSATLNSGATIDS